MMLLSRRDFLIAGGLAFVTTAGAAGALMQNRKESAFDAQRSHSMHMMQQGIMETCPEQSAKWTIRKMGSGAIFEVVYEIAKLIQKDTARQPMPMTIFSGVLTGMLML